MRNIDQGKSGMCCRAAECLVDIWLPVGDLDAESISGLAGIEGVAGIDDRVTDGARFPPLILVTTGPGGDLVVLEGHARLTAFMLSRDRLPPELEVLVGSSPAR